MLDEGKPAHRPVELLVLFVILFFLNTDCAPCLLSSSAVDWTRLTSASHADSPSGHRVHLFSLPGHFGFILCISQSTATRCWETSPGIMEMRVCLLWRPSVSPRRPVVMLHTEGSRLSRCSESKQRLSGHMTTRFVLLVTKHHLFFMGEMVCIPGRIG